MTVVDPAGADRSAPTVLIVGAGPTGLMLACELARRDVSFRLIEAVAGPQPGARGKASSRGRSRCSTSSGSASA